MLQILFNSVFHFKDHTTEREGDFSHQNHGGESHFWRNCVIPTLIESHKDRVTSRTAESSARIFTCRLRECARNYLNKGVTICPTRMSTTTRVGGERRRGAWVGCCKLQGAFFAAVALPPIWNTRTHSQMLTFGSLLPCFRSANFCAQNQIVVGIVIRQRNKYIRQISLLLLLSCYTG